MALPENLTDQDIIVLQQLHKNSWQHDLPPTLRQMAAAAGGKAEVTIRERITRLIAAGLVRREDIAEVWTRPYRLTPEGEKWLEDHSLTPSSPVP